MQVAEARPPYVTFEVRAVEDRAASIDSGYYKTRDVDFAFITPQGSKDRIEREVQSWFDNLGEQVQQQRFPAEWKRHFEEAYKAWKEGRELPLNGTPIVTWPVLSPSQVKALLDARVKTVEDLAGANEETLNRIGMGSRTLKDKAVSWMTAAGGTGKVAEEMNALKAANKALTDRNEELAKQLKELAANVAALKK
jgi:hypothetical protein